MKTRALQLVLIACISAFAGYYVGVNKISYDWKNYRPEISVINKEPPSSLSQVDFTLFWNVWQKLENSYYDKKVIEPQKLVNGAISGMVESLGDPYTMFLPPVQNSSFKESMAGQFQGIGAELDMKNKQIIVVAPLDGSPAEKAGIRAGDAILEVNNQSTSGWTLNQAVEKIRGPKGTPVKLAILQKDSTRPKDVNIVRDVISIKSVYGWVKKVKDVDGIKLTNNLKKEEERKVIYLRLSQFGDNTNQEWLGLVNNIYLEVGKDKDFKGVVVDLRNNPGGYLTDATFIASEFIKDGTVVIQDKGNGDKNHFSVTRKGLLVDTPVVVLINKGSASASEIVAGAIRDHKKGKLIGETSFGKGTIQQAEDLGDGAGLHVTIAKWLTPKEIWVHNQGLTPDVKVSLDEKDPSHDIQLEKAIEELLKS